MLKSGQLKTKIHKIYPLEDITEVHNVGSPLLCLYYTPINHMFYRISRDEGQWERLF